MAVLLNAACGAPPGANADVDAPGEGGTAGGERPPDAIELLPSDTMAIVRLDVSQLRRSPYAETVKQMLAQTLEAAAEAEESGMNWDRISGLIERTDQAYFAFVPGATPEAEPDAMLIARGTYRPNELEDLAAEQVERHDGRLDIRERDGLRILESEGVVGTSIGDHTWIISTSAGRLDDALARVAGGGGATPRSSGRFRDMADRVRFDEASVAAVAEPTGELARQIERELPRGLQGGFEAFGGRLDANDGIDAIAILETGDARLAQGAAEIVREQIRELRGQMMLNAVGLGPVLAGVNVRVDGKTLVVTLQVSDADTRTLLSRLGGFITLMLQAAASEGLGGFGGGDTPEPPPPVEPTPDSP